MLGDRDTDCAQGRTGVVLVCAVSVLVALTLFGRYSSGAATGLLTLDVVVGVLSCALLPVLLRRTVPGALGLAALAVLSPAATPPATFATVLVAQRRPLGTASA
ncbi:MAG: hypothetical protein ACRDQ0_20280, partial [Pseudonocardia sp.]